MLFALGQLKHFARFELSRQFGITGIKDAHTASSFGMQLEFRQKRVSIGILEEISKIILEKANAPHYSTPI
jgi:hypothetical protein